MVRTSSITSGTALLRKVRDSFSKFQSGSMEIYKTLAIIRFLASPEDPPEVQKLMEASRVSADQKVKNLSYLGFEVNHVVLPSNASEQDFVRRIVEFNEDPATSGIIVQMPTPRRFSHYIQLIHPDKDIDALLGERSSYPACATADGIVRIVDPFYR